MRNYAKKMRFPNSLKTLRMLVPHAVWMGWLTFSLSIWCYVFWALLWTGPWLQRVSPLVHKYWTNTSSGRQNAWYWGYSSAQNRHWPCPHGPESLEGKENCQPQILFSGLGVEEHLWVSLLIQVLYPYVIKFCLLLVTTFSLMLFVPPALLISYIWWWY